MKRFFCAIIILIIILSLSGWLNYKIVKLSKEMSAILTKGTETDIIIKKWNENKMLFSLLLSQSQTEKIQKLIYLLKDNKSETDYTELNNEFESIIDSMSLNLMNVL